MTIFSLFRNISFYWENLHATYFGNTRHILIYSVGAISDVILRIMTEIHFNWKTIQCEHWNRLNNSHGIDMYVIVWWIESRRLDSNQNYTHIFKYTYDTLHTQFRIYCTSFQFDCTSRVKKNQMHMCAQSYWYKIGICINPILIHTHTHTHIESKL